MGARWADAVRSSNETKLSAIVDVDEAKAHALAGKHNVPAVGSIKELPSDTVAVIIAVPHIFLAKTAGEALESGKHVLVEKPVGISTDEIKTIRTLAENKNLRLMAGYNHRFLPHVRKAKKLAESGAIGEIMFIRARHGASGRPGYEKEWRHQRKLGGGILLDQAVHGIDLIRWFLGDIAETKGIAENLFWKSEVEDNAFLLLKTVDGKIASLHASWTEWKPIFSLEIFGTDGYLIVEGLAKYMQKERLAVAKRSPDFLGSKIKEEIREFNEGPNDSLGSELEEFIASIREKRNPEPNAKDAEEILKIISHLK